VRVILDTNVLVSALAKPGSVPGQVLQAWRDHRYELLSSAEHLTEIRRVTRYPKVAALITASRVGNMVSRIREDAVLLDHLPHVDESPDPNDNYLLAMAQKGNAHLLVIGDKADLLGLIKFSATRIISARQFADILKI
jgi:uncharacterized protein